MLMEGCYGQTIGFRLMFSAAFNHSDPIAPKKMIQPDGRIRLYGFVHSMSTYLRVVP